MFIIICYDIIDNIRRTKVSKQLENYGVRVQYSVFEANLDDRKTEEMVSYLRKSINEEEDGLRIYRVCAGCFKNIQVIGIGEVTRDRDIYIV